MAQSFITRNSDTLIIRNRQTNGRSWTWELEQKPRTVSDIQEIIDGLVDSNDEVVSVWRVETNEHGTPIIVDDITGLFDVRSAEEIVEASKLARERAFEAPAFIQPYSTVNHAQQGIGR
jgi:hypothetical protein